MRMHARERDGDRKKARDRDRKESETVCDRGRETQQKRVGKQTEKARDRR